MNMYTGMMALVLILAYLMRADLAQNRKSYIWVSCFAMFVLCGCRDVFTIGVDSASSYIRIYHEIGALNWSELPTLDSGEANLGYAYICKLVYTLTDGDYQSFIILYSAFIMTVFARFVEKYSVSPVQSFCYFWGLLCYSFLFDSLKQGIAMAFITLAFDAIVEKRPIRFTVLVYLAYLVHLPALVFLPAYLIAKMRPGRAYLVLLAIMLIFTYRFREEILELMLSVYGTEMHMNDMDFLGNKVLIMIGIVAAALVLRPPSADDRVYGILLQFMGISIVIQTFASYNNTFERLANYYFQFCVIFIPLVFQTDRRRSTLLDVKTEAMGKQLAPWLFSAFGVWRYAHIITSQSWIWLPYRFFFE